MADTKISALTAATALTGAEQFPVVQGGATVRTTVADLSAAYEALDPDRLTLGEATMHRRHISSATVLSGSGALRLTYFTARKTETTTQVRLISGATAAAATPTLVRAGLYTVAGNGDIALVASIANDTALFAAGSTLYTRSWSVPYAKVAGQRYALGILVVTGATAPSYLGQSVLSAFESTAAPRLGGAVTGQTDLPASVVSASIVDSGNLAYSVILP